jgi:transposase-like protein
VRSRVLASERTSQRIEELVNAFEAHREGPSFQQLGLRKLIEELLEAEVSERLGRSYYERGREGSEGLRNGYRTGRLKTAEGEVEYSVPQVRGLEEAFRSRLRPELGKRTEALEDLAVEMYARGLSTRDIEAALCDEKGRSLLSRTAVSQVTERLWEESEAFASRDLSEDEIAYLFADGIAERLHGGQRREAVLCAWGITTEGQKVLLHLSPGTKEDTESCRAFFQDLKRRGLSDPLFVATDGAPGLIRAVEECFPRSERGRCLAHRMRNLQSKVPDSDWPEFREKAKAAYQAPSRDVARMLRDVVVSEYEKRFPSAVKCFLDDFEACIAHLRFPIAHRRVIRTTNLLERLFGEERRRMKIVANAFGERAVLKLMYAALIRASESWRGVQVKPFEVKQLEAVGRELDTEYERRHEPAITKSEGASPSRKSSGNRT